MDYRLELVLIPVSDVDRAKDFYIRQAGFDLLVDTPIGEGRRVVQVTPPGSACSVGFGTGLLDAAPGTYKGLHLVVEDIVAARAAMVDRGVAVSNVRHLASGSWVDGPDPDHASYNSFADFADPDGNQWLLQEVRRAGSPG